LCAQKHGWTAPANQCTLSPMANWNNITSRGDVDDRRGSVASIGGSIGFTGIALLLLLNYAQTGTVDVNTLARELQQIQSQQQHVDTRGFEGKDTYEVFASTVLGSTTDAWSTQFAQIGRRYTPPRFVLFRNGTESGCGGAYSQIGPHYCPPDQTVYLDETFFEELKTRFGATGDVAQAYVIAHEVGHHVQTLLSLESDSISQELQADCFAGVWAHSIKDQGVFEQGEIKEALDAASAVGDDHIQEVTEGTINPETWTHGSSAQRVASFNKGYSRGTLATCK
jgi:uncharacterized protein